jgi:predicted  nucleic acid-binding Zn-ribbon protein
MRAEPLGALLLGRGLIEPEQLEIALTEQKATGRPLGEIIVTRGFAAAPTVAQALATQHGGLLKTEYGFATGWGGGTAAAPAGQSNADDSLEVAALRASLEEHKTALAAWQQAHAELQAELAARKASIEQLESGAASLEQARTELEQALQNEIERGTALREELSSAGAPESVRGEFEQRLAATEAEALERLEAAKSEFSSARAELEERLTEAHERVASLEGELAAREAAVEAASEERIEAAKAELEQRLVEAQTHSAALEAELARRDAEGEASSQERLDAARAEFESTRAEIEQRLREAQERAASLEEKLAARDTEIDTASQDRLDTAKAEFASARAELEQRLGEAHERAATLEAELAEREAKAEELRAVPAGRWDAAELHLLFFQGSDGYELVERPGPPPAAGSLVDGRLVSRVDASPVPGNAVPCAYLIA